MIYFAFAFDLLDEAAFFNALADVISILGVFSVEGAP